MFEKIFVTQDYLIASKIADYFSYPIDVPIPVRTMNPEGELLLIDGHHHLSALFLRKQEPSIIRIESEDQGLIVENYPTNLREFIENRNLAIKMRYSAIMEGDHEKKKRTISSLLRSPQWIGKPALDELIMSRERGLALGVDLYKEWRVKDLSRFKN